ncbi:MAG: hypothetical protein ABIB79_05570 [archaeon]
MFEGIYSNPGGLSDSYPYGSHCKENCLDGTTKHLDALESEMQRAEEIGDTQTFNRLEKEFHKVLDTQCETCPRLFIKGLLKKDLTIKFLEEETPTVH